MTNVNNINMRTVIMIAAVSILLLIDLSTAHGQIVIESGGEGAGSGVAYTSESLRDPFQSYVKREVAAPTVTQFEDEETVPLPTLTISGITWGSSYAQAIINGKVVRAGDMVDNVQIVSISKNGVVIVFNNQNVTLPAPGSGGVKK